VDIKENVFLPRRSDKYRTVRHAADTATNRSEINIDTIEKPQASDAKRISVDLKDIRSL
jgi:hypothetical protein